MVPSSIGYIIVNWIQMAQKRSKWQRRLRILGLCYSIMFRGRINMLHVHPLLGKGLVNKFRQIQSVVRLRNNSDKWRSVFNVGRPMSSARQQICKHFYNNRRRFLCLTRAEVL
jgi:hypothetical protein